MYLNLMNQIAALSTAPSRLDPSFAHWISQGDTANFLKANATASPFILYASADHVFLRTMVAPSSTLENADPLELREWDLMNDQWGLNYGWDNNSDVWLTRPFDGNRCRAYRESEPILHHRSFEGYYKAKAYFELSQKLAHIFDLHFVAHKKAWCRLDQSGDLEPVVQIHPLPKGRTGYGGDVVTIDRKVFDAYLLAGRLKAICVFDFTRYDPKEFHGWGDPRERESEVNDGGIIYRLTVQPGLGSYLRGAQIISPIETMPFLHHRLRHNEPKQYAAFIAFDVKNNIVKEISCAPGATVNYFTKSDLPFEVTPAFFKPDVLQKYKADTSKYKIEERSIYCRGAWSLQTYDINDAGQVHTYLVYLRSLPYSEQLYWKSFNEPPKSGISRRAFATDIQGDFYLNYNALQSIKKFARGLQDRAVKWWSLKDERLLENIHYPVTSSRDEWAEEILRLDQLVIEGLDTKWLRKMCRQLGSEPEASEGSLALLYRCLSEHDFTEEEARAALAPLRELHNLRSKIKGHAKGSEAETLQENALNEHGSYRGHFEALCERCDTSLRRIADGLSEIAS